MGMLKLGEKIRLNGQDAKDYLADTGRTALPTTVNEFNTAQQQAANAWRSADCPEGEFLAFLCEENKIQ